MKRRVFLFAIGLGLGVLLSRFLFSDKAESARGWMPNERVIKRLLETERIITPLAACQLECIHVATDGIDALIKGADVDFKKSQTRGETLQYFLRKDELEMHFTVKGDSTWLAGFESGLPAGCLCP